MSDLCGIDTEKYPHQIIFQNRKRKWLTLDIEYIVLPHIKGLTATSTDEYKCNVSGELEDDFSLLWSKLLKKMDDISSVKYLEKVGFTSKAVGYVCYNSETDEHEFVVDGKHCTLEDIGRWMRGHEGFQMKIEFADLSDDLL